MKSLLDWFIARSKEKTTWVGLIGLLTASGVALNADMTDSIIAFGTALGGLVSAILTVTNTTDK